MMLREGDFVKSNEEVIFDVKGLVHPPNKVIAFPRFIPDSKGLRQLGEAKYGKIYGIAERFNFLEKFLPNYIVYDPVFDEKLCEIPFENISQVYSPVKRLEEMRKSLELDDLEKTAFKCLKALKELAKIPWESIGVSGSLLVKLHTFKSDIDLVFYGSENCWRIYSALQKLLGEKDSLFNRYTIEDLKVLYDFRSRDTLMNFEDFLAVESRKVLQGKFMGRDYFIRFVKDWKEVKEHYGDVRYKSCGYARVVARVVDDSQSVFTPCTYRVENVRIIEGGKVKPIREIASFRGRFCEQAKCGETVVAQGKVEHVSGSKRDQEYFRLLLGNKTSDFMVLKR